MGKKYNYKTRVSIREVNDLFSNKYVLVYDVNETHKLPPQALYPKSGNFFV